MQLTNKEGKKIFGWKEMKNKTRLKKYKFKLKNAEQKSKYIGPS